MVLQRDSARLASAMSRTQGKGPLTSYLITKYGYDVVDKSSERAIPSEFSTPEKLDEIQVQKLMANSF